MELDVDQKLVGTIPKELIDNILNSINDEDWFVADYRKTVGNMSNCNTISIIHTPLCASGWSDMRPIRAIRKEKQYEKFFPLVEPILEILKEHYDFRQYSMFIARLAPNSTIGEHIDRGNFLSLCHRIHVPLKSSPEVKYIIDNVPYYWEPGNVYEFNNMKPHRVENDSNDYRIHLVINLYNLTDEELNS